MSQNVSHFPNPVTLIVLAAGMGSRFGGLKQLFPVGHKKQTILEYTLDDAEAAGIRKVVFVIRKDIEKEFREVILEKLFRRPFEIKLAFQDTHALPAGHRVHPERKRPFGTGHALLVGMEAMRTTSAVVVNADDYYGANALKQAAEAAGWGRNAVVAYPLEGTLSHRGPVSRGIVEMDARGQLKAIEETHNLTHQNASANALASLNLIALGASSRPLVEENWKEFCTSGGLATVDKECFLPDALLRMVKQGVAVEVMKTTDAWIGLTHRDDLPEVELRIGRTTSAPFAQERE